MENLFLKKLKPILFQYFLFKVINLNFEKNFFEFFSSKNQNQKFAIFRDTIKNLVHFLKDENNTII